MIWVTSFVWAGICLLVAAARLLTAIDAVGIVLAVIGIVDLVVGFATWWLHMTQRQLAEKADIDYQTVSTLENGYKGPRWDTLMMVTEVLGMEVKVERRAK